jgi:CelD/BcsL family acetyltransferase involved in cellulose biosynthesis
MIDCQVTCDACKLLEAGDDWRIQLHTAGDSLARLRREWDRLLAESDNNQFFSLNAWHSVWWAHFGHDFVFRIVTVRESTGKLVGIAPLMAPKDSPESTLSFMGGTEVADYLDFIVEAQNAGAIRSVLLDAIRKYLDWQTLDLHCLQQRSPTSQAVQDSYPPHGIRVMLEQEDVSPFVAMHGSWDAYLASLSKKDRHELRRKLRRAVDDQGALWRSAKTMEELQANFDAFIALHRLSSPSKAEFMTDTMEAYFRDLLAMALEHGWLRMGVLWVGESPVSGAVGFAYGDRLYLYNSGYDPAFAAHSVGIAAVGLLLRDTAQEGLAIFDFLQGNESYKYMLGAQDDPVNRVVSTREQQA